ncbi:MAG: twin-arginine translocase subunit TatC [Actinomycetota bacterium]|nr:twin-arginine translocase subunit TatC [Actinomycetota bacterium]
MARKPKRLKPAEFDDRLTLVEHLDELRSRIIFSGVFLLLAIVGCFLIEDTILEIANEPLPEGYLPITLSPTEPFFTTVKLSVYGGLLISLPVLLYQTYAFILPAFAPGERKLILPFLLSVPVLFIGGAVFAYFVVMPAALDFLLGFNSDSFQIEIRGSEYYGFFILTLIAVGFLFQIPVFVLAVCRLGIVTPEQLAANRRYAVLLIAVAAMLLPGTDPVTMILSMAPLYLLFEFSLVMARRFGRPPGEGDD